MSNFHNRRFEFHAALTKNADWDAHKISDEELTDYIENNMPCSCWDDENESGYIVTYNDSWWWETMSQTQLYPAEHDAFYRFDAYCPRCGETLEVDEGI